MTDSQELVGLTPGDIEWAYLTILGRAPENGAIVDQWCSTPMDLKTFIETLARSDEARQRDPQMTDLCGPDRMTQSLIVNMLRKLAPHDVCDYAKVRIGQIGDGGYVMLDDFKETDIAYSLGINNDVSWDLNVAAYGLDIFQYDHTIDALPIEHARFRWEKIGIAAERSDDTTMRTLDSLIEQNGHSSRTDIILKCDIEGAEWDVLDKLSVETLSQFKQIVLEVHWLDQLSNPSFLQRAARVIDKLTKHHLLIHVHGNNCAPFVLVAGIPLPMVLEFSMVRNDRDKTFRPSCETFPSSLDTPNLNEFSLDYFLGSFRF